VLSHVVLLVGDVVAPGTLDTAWWKHDSVKELLDLEAALVAKGKIVPGELFSRGECRDALLSTRAIDVDAAFFDPLKVGKAIGAVVMFDSAVGGGKTHENVSSSGDVHDLVENGNKKC